MFLMHENITTTFLTDEGIFRKAFIQSTKRLILNLKDLELMSNESAAMKLHNIDPFGLKSIFKFVHSIKEESYFEFSQTKEVLDELVFTKYQHLISQNGFDSLLKRMSTASINCPNVEFSKMQATTDKKEVLKIIYNASLEHAFDHWDSKAQYKAFSDKVKFFEWVVSPFSTEDNILGKTITFDPKTIDFSKVFPENIEEVVANAFPNDKPKEAIAGIKAAVSSKLLQNLFNKAIENFFKVEVAGFDLSFSETPLTFDQLIKGYASILEIIKYAGYTSLAHFSKGELPFYAKILANSQIFKFSTHFTTPSIELLVQTRNKLNSFPIVLIKIHIS